MYLSEFGRKGWLAPTTRFINDILLSAPSIAGSACSSTRCTLVQVQHFSGWAGSLALGANRDPGRRPDHREHAQPWFRRVSARPPGPRCAALEGGAACALRAARAGVLTGVLLAVARVSGETAPLLFTALNNQFTNFDLNGPMANLPVVIFQFAMSPYENWNSLAWGGAILITFGVLCLNIVVRTLFRKKI